MGRQIVKGISRDKCERRSRLWYHDDVINVLANYRGTDAIEGLSLKAEVTAVENFEVKAFSNMEMLRLLQLSHVHLKGSYEKFPKRLRWLCWLGFPRHSIPTDFFLGSLVVMDMQYSNLKRLWGDRKSQILTDLKYLDLSHSVQLTDTPNFSNLPNLEKLLLINCKSLVRVHKSIGSLQNKLILLNLKGCTKLGDLPLELYTLKSLETLILSGCSKLKRLDDDIRKLISLTTLKADYTALTQIPSSTYQLNKIEELSFEGCKGSHQAALSIPLSLNRLSCLKTLRLSFCNLSDEKFLENLGSLSCLEELDLEGNNFLNLQADFAGLLSLQILKLDGCSELHSMFSLPKKLRSFYATNCPMLERTPDLSECSVLQSLHLTNCFNLVETPGLNTLKTVGVIQMEMCNRIPDTYRESIMQGWAVGANGGIFIPGSSLPNWVSFKNETYSISFTVPETLNPDLVGFTMWTSYVSQKNDEMSEYSPKITLKNQTKGEVWRRNLATDMIRLYREKHIWQGHFSNEDFSLETGDQVEVSVNFGDQVTILETGLTLAYREANTEISDVDTSNIGYEEIAVEQLIQTEEVDDELVTEEIAVEQLIQTEEVDDELVTEENQSRPPRKRRGGLKKLLRVFCLAAVIM
ncbi:Disease resistance protein RPV1 [Cardamine amara subsp. amara]|uniref:Disease resistance protein RPV1 n=1 Tax=Cardamine amara subsp. amara TaxID=228776 RepID=A0ABD1BBL8_CARAN